MSAKFRTRGIFAGAMLAATLGLATPAAAQSTVVRATGPSAAEYPAGKKLESGARVVLAAGDIVTVVDAGGTRVFKGPDRFTIGARRAAERDVLGTFITRRGSRERVRIGATRGDVGQEGPVPAPTVWLLEWGQAGPFCYTGEGRLFVWRPENSGAARLSIKATEGIATTSLAWEDGSRISAWPQDLAPLDAGATYTIALEGGQEQFDISFVRLATEPQDVTELVSVLTQNGCTGQIDRLIAAGGGEDSSAAAE